MLDVAGETQVSQIQRELEAPPPIAGGRAGQRTIGTPGADGQPSLSLSRGS